MLDRMLELRASGESVSGSGGSWRPLFIYCGPVLRVLGQDVLIAASGWEAVLALAVNFCIALNGIFPSRN